MPAAHDRPEALGQVGGDHAARLHVGGTALHHLEVVGAGQLKIAPASIVGRPDERGAEVSGSRFGHRLALAIAVAGLRSPGREAAERADLACPLKALDFAEEGDRDGPTDLSDAGQAARQLRGIDLLIGGFTRRLMRRQFGRAVMPALAGLLAALVVILGLFWLASGIQAPAAILTFATGAVAFALISGMHTRVVTSASLAPTLAVAVNASGFQLVRPSPAGWAAGS